MRCCHGSDASTDVIKRYAEQITLAIEIKTFVWKI